MKIIDNYYSLIQMLSILMIFLENLTWVFAMYNFQKVGVKKNHLIPLYKSHLDFTILFFSSKCHFFEILLWRAQVGFLKIQLHLV